ncbi:hypothetical protein PAXRUDRAFT_440617 [Paxillus rubicundulus Ve08.2h10]|uniref:Uncharacterized protein n=1 Tax=Paxillus rubicundulus Ve08.2h10 TaxID=930991 RepID=A0A0D0DQE5_9AGAM|nr:hypothetical protein PAXRUDRAFT_440617 [Paxillus rubicundulus Ve08.2h10]
MWQITSAGVGFKLRNIASGEAALNTRFTRRRERRNRSNRSMMEVISVTFTALVYHIGFGNRRCSNTGSCSHRRLKESGASAWMRSYWRKSYDR